LIKYAHPEAGYTLLEMMAVILVVVVMTLMTMPRLQEQIANRAIETLARRFVMHANFARNQALHLGHSVQIAPLVNDDWNQGWVVKDTCFEKSMSSDCISKNWIAQGAITPIYFKARGFSDPHSRRAEIVFNSAGAAKTGQGGFVANRLIMGHQNYPKMERHLILSSGGRWRICDPQTDAKSCR
jgi:type IV fimbrial biogenesis protein FimT